MNILIIGSGGREYAIALRLKQDKTIQNIYFSPGNGATTKLGSNIISKDYYELAEFAKINNIGLTIVGPEDALSNGVVDIFKENGLNIFGPSKAAAMLESSKVFMKNFLDKNHIKTAKFIDTSSLDEAEKFIDKLKGNIVVKADGLCGGKGVVIAQDRTEAKEVLKNMLSGKSFGDSGKKVVIEEFLDGFELSFFAICDGENFVSLPVAQDHKKLLDGDMGVNTGGMGAYAPSPLASKELIKKVEDDIIKPTLRGMKRDGNIFCGVLFAGLMIVDNEPYVLEFNVRFGDPECEVLMPLIQGNLSEILLNATMGKLDNIKLSDEVAVGVVIASENYPFKSSLAEKIQVKSVPSETFIAYASVSSQNGELYANSGRVLVAVGVGKDIKDAHKKAYDLVRNIEFKGMKYRKDIAYQALQ